MERLRRRQDVSEIDFLLIILMLWWGFWMFMPFSEIDDAYSYRYMFNLADRYVWGTLTLIFVFLKIYAILRCRWKLRMATLLLFMSWWTFLSSMVFLSNPTTPGWGMIGFIAVISFWRHLQIAVMGKEIENNCEL